MKVTHLTSVHFRYDTRIFLKECKSLANNEYDVTLIVADGKGNEVREGIKIIDVGRKKNRITRIFILTFLVWRKALLTKAGIYHIHDPELLPIGLFIRLFGCKVVYDMHENLPKQLLSKYYLNKSASIVLSKIMLLFQNIAFRIIPVIFAENSYVKDFCLVKKSITLLNYPIIGNFAVKPKCCSRKLLLGYIGEISDERGINQIIRVIENYCNQTIELMLAGSLRPDVEENISFKNAQLQGWLTYHGILSPMEALGKMQSCDVGLAVLFPSPNFKESYPTKLFEYMTLGLPVIASDFPLWKEIIEGNQCGICVNPMDPKAISGAIDYMTEHPEEAAEMGKRGREAVEEKYNWATEEIKLINIYKNLLGSEE